MIDTPQPSPWSPARASEIIDAGAGVAGALLPLLHALQAEFGHVPDNAVPLLASALNLSRAEVHGVLSFYHDFRRSPAAGLVIRLCRAEACQARGARSVELALTEALGVEMNGPAGAGDVALEAVYCLGLCASGPAALVNGRPVARLEGPRLDRLIKDMCS